MRHLPLGPPPSLLSPVTPPAEPSPGRQRGQAMTLTLSPQPLLGNGVAAEWGWGSLLSHVRMEYAHAAFPLSPKKPFSQKTCSSDGERGRGGPSPPSLYSLYPLSALPLPPPASASPPPLRKGGLTASSALSVERGPHPTLSISGVKFINEVTRHESYLANTVW